MSCNCGKNPRGDSLSNLKQGSTRYEVRGPDIVNTPSNQTTAHEYALYKQLSNGNWVKANDLLLDNCLINWKIEEVAGGVSDTSNVVMCNSWDSTLEQCDDKMWNLNSLAIQLDTINVYLVTTGSAIGKVRVIAEDVVFCDSGFFTPSPDSRFYKDVQLEFPVGIGGNGGGGTKQQCEFELEGPASLNAGDFGWYAPKNADGKFTWTLHNPAWTLIYGKNQYGVALQPPNFNYYWSRNLQPDSARLDVTKTKPGCWSITKSYYIEGLPIANYASAIGDWKFVGSNIWGYGPITGVDPGNIVFGGNWDWPNPHHNPGSAKNNQGNSFK